MRGAKPPRPGKPVEIWTEITGIHVGRRRRDVERYCGEGTTLALLREPWNSDDPNAVAVWIRTRGLFGAKKIKLGYLPREDAQRVGSYLDREWSPECSVYMLKYVEDGRLYPKINVLLTPPEMVDASTLPDAPQAPPPRPRFRPKLQIVLPETWLQRAVLAATFMLAEGLGCVLLGIVLGPMLGRQSDILGLGVVAMATGAGIWALAMLSRVK